MTYLFGDTELAARRLRVLARVFEPPTLDFLTHWRTQHGGLDPQTPAPTALDLGCGPGHTTRLLATVLGCHVVGLDASDAFLYEARRLQPSRVSFQHHDITDAGFPTPEASFMYSRFLLTHLPHLGAVFSAWRANLKPGGWILLEEPEWIATEVEPFRVYLDLIARSLRARSTELYVGPRLASEARAIGGLTVMIDRVAELDVTDRDAATMFAWNLPTVRGAYDAAGASGEASAAAVAAPTGDGASTAPAVTAAVATSAASTLATTSAPPLAPHAPRPDWLPPAAELDALQQELDDLAHMTAPATHIRWGVRQVALRMD